MDRLLHSQITAGVAIAIVLGLVLLAVKRHDRASIRNTLVLLALFVLLEVVGWGLDIGGSPRGAKLVSDAAAVGVGAVLIRLGCMMLFRVVLPAVRYVSARIVEDLFTTALAVAWLVYWLHGAGLDLASLLTTSAVITAVLAFSMQDTLGNVLGGVVLQLDDSVRVGDWVKVDDVSGQVVDVRWRHTAILTRNRETVVLPNGWLVKNRFMIIGARSDVKPRWRRWVWFNISLDASPGQVCQVLESAVRNSEIPNVLQDPPPNAVLMEVGNGFARYALRYWMNEPRADDPTDSMVRMHALAALARHDIRLALAQEERLIIKENEARRAALRAEEVARRRRALAGVDLFRPLSDDERDALAESLVPAPFVAGDTITRQGAVAHWLYLIIGGEADVWAETGGQRVHVATLHAGNVFGEMALLTGEPRGATVTARTDVECFRLDKAAFESVLRARPDVTGEISRVIGERRGALDTARVAVANGSANAPQDALLARIRSFFGLDEG